MTVKSEVSRVSYTGDGATVLFPVPFYFISGSDLRVIRRAADGTEVTLSLVGDYTVSGAGVETGGAVTLASAPVAGVKLVIYREPPMTQTADYVEGGRFPAASHESALDRIVMMVQRVFGMASLSLRLGETDVSGNGRYRAGGNRISGVGDPFNADDAVNKGYFDTHASTAAADASGYASDAAASATAADASKTAASGYATASAISATTATTAAASALTSANNAAAIAGFDPALFLLKSGNLSGLASLATAQANLGLSAVAASGSYADLSNKPAITYAALPDKPTFSTVAATGAYGDLTGLPTLGGAASRNVGTVSGTVAAGDDPRFDQSSKAPLVSPALSGVPTAPTAAAGTNNQQIATTAFVMTNAGATNYLAVGAYVQAVQNFTTAIPGATITLDGTHTLIPASSGGNYPAAPITTGVWRAMGYGGSGFATIWVRVS